MSTMTIILNALGPVAFVMFLGVAAGLTGIIKPSGAGLLATLVMQFTLPIQLFNATATMSTAEMPGWQYFVAIGLGLLSIFIIALAVAIWIFHISISEASLQALNSAFPNMAFIGFPVLGAVMGHSSVVAVVVGLLISSLILPPIALTLLAAGSPDQKGHSSAAVIGGSLLGAIKQPLVWAPILGVVFLIAHIQLPDIAQKSFTLIGEATSGVALFALGLLLSGQRLKLGIAAVVNTVFKLIAQPVAMWLFAVLLGVTGALRRDMILLGALPTASFTVIFAIQYKVYTEESDETILLSTILSFVTLAAIIAITG